METKILNTVFQMPQIKLSYHSITMPVETPIITTPKVAYDILINSWDKDILELQEQFKILLLDSVNHVLGIYECTSGGLDATIVDARLIFTAALLTKSSCIILCHNHPSGKLNPSDGDKNITTRIANGAKLLNIKLFDHIILSAGGYYSFSDNGLL